MITWTSIGNFTQELKNVLEQFEGKHYTAYDDGTGRLTIGVGFNISDAEVRRKIFAALGVDIDQQLQLTSVQRTAENKFIDALTAAIKAKDTDKLDTIMQERADYYAKNGTPTGLLVRKNQMGQLRFVF